MAEAPWDRPTRLNRKPELPMLNFVGADRIRSRLAKRSQPAHDRIHGWCQRAPPSSCAQHLDRAALGGLALAFEPSGQKGPRPLLRSRLH